MHIKNKLAYCAGLIDGEGSLYISKDKHKKMTAGIKLAMNDKAGLILFQSIFGGNIIKGTCKICKNSGEIYSPAWVLQFRAKQDIKHILNVLIPYLQVKKEQAQILLEFLAVQQTNLLSPFRKQAYLHNKYVQSRAVKKRYWNKPILYRKANK